MNLPSKKVLPYVNWSKLSSDAISAFELNMTQKLDEINVPFYAILHGDKCCSNEYHRSQIETYFHDIQNAVLFADSLLPRTSPATHKPYWSSNIDDLKKKSIDCCRNWQANGAPRHGPLFDCKKVCTSQYKKAIRNARRDCNKKTNDAMHNDLTALDSNSFWKSWRSHNKNTDSPVTRVDGEVTGQGIAGAFQKHFEKVYSDNKTPMHESLKSQFQDNFSRYCISHGNDSISPYFLSWADMVEIVGKLKAGKSSSGSIKPEHIFHGSTKLILHLHLLFNAMIQHGIVVDDFLRGNITPIVKDLQGDMSSSANYRGITIGSLFSKLFEFALDLKITPFLECDHLQFGFKKRTSTSHALFTLRSTINHFTKRGSDTFVAFLDCTKAFDRISHYGLFNKLMERNVPLCLLLIIICWHVGMACRVRWDDTFSEYFSVPLGTKQGGISSPGLFSLYINDMILELRKLGVGCHLIKLFVGCILFADDLALMAPTRAALQKMIDVCSLFMDTNCLQFNAKKSKVMVFGRSHKETDILHLTIDGNALDYVTEWKYLGVTLSTGMRLCFNARPDLACFFRATNSVLNALKGAKEDVLLKLLYSNCVPILTYACEVKEYSASDMSDCSVAMNNAFRKIFGFKEWRSIRVLREIFNVKCLYTIFKLAKDKFIASCRSHSL